MQMTQLSRHPVGHRFKSPANVLDSFAIGTQIGVTYP
jgi:hypothetical protein